jgi:hypothetical protein
MHQRSVFLVARVAGEVRAMALHAASLKRLAEVPERCFVHRAHVLEAKPGRRTCHRRDPLGGQGFDRYVIRHVVLLFDRPQAGRNAV